jgi:signal transduction histidine kinase/ActR/RegA family two-component response regulator
MDSKASEHEHRVLLLAPSGRDGVLAAKMLEQAGAEALVCETSDAFLQRLGEGAGVALIAEEALQPDLFVRLTDVLASQPAWSDFPFIIFTSRSASASENRRTIEAFANLGNITALERPIHPLTMVSAVRAALRARTRQYNARAFMEEREREVRQRDQFLALLGHELRNPLGALRNAAELLQRNLPPTSRLDRPLSIIDRQLRNLTQLVNDLLDVARVTSGKIALKPVPTDFGALTRALVEDFARSARDRHLAVQFFGSDRPVIVMGDPIRLDQIVNNLLTNALKYTPAGGRVEVSVTGGPYATLRVADTGVGISADVLPTIFEPFTQAEGTLDRAQGGMGLGLSVVRALVRLHGGDVTASSPGPGRGTEFVIHLPCFAAESRTSISMPPSSLPQAATGRHILIVEDGADNRESLRDLLESYGHRVDTAVDGEQGVEQALSRRPEMALVDIGLPLVDGYEVARRIRAAMGSQIFLVALTGYGQPEDRARASSAGFDIHLTKPVDVETLADLLEHLPIAAVAAPSAQAVR